MKLPCLVVFAFVASSLVCVAQYPAPRGPAPEPTPAPVVVSDEDVAEVIDRFAVEPVAGFMLGNTTYHISGYDGVPWASELQFPLDVPVAGGELRFSFKSPVLFSHSTLGVRFMGSLSDSAGDMRDFDWVPEGVLRGDTRSSASLDATMLSVYLKGPFYIGPGWWWGETITFNGVVEYAHQEFDYEVFGLDGWYSLDGPPSQRTTVSESSDTKVMTYNVKYDTLCVGGEVLDTFASMVTFEGSLLGGIAFVSDKDDHLLRSKLSEGDAVGLAIKLHGAAVYNAMWGGDSARWYLKGALDFMAVSSVGEQDQAYYDGSDGSSYTIDLDETMEQVMVTASIGCAF